MQDPERYGWFSLAVSLGQHGIIGRWDHGISMLLCVVKVFLGVSEVLAGQGWVTPVAGWRAGSY